MKHNWARFDTPCGNSSAEDHSHLELAAYDAIFEGKIDLLEAITNDDKIMLALIKAIVEEKKLPELMRHYACVYNVITDLDDIVKLKEFRDLIEAEDTEFVEELYRYVKSCPSVIGKAEGMSR
jgi:hypothetical protein